MADDLTPSLSLKKKIAVPHAVRSATLSRQVRTLVMTDDKVIMLFPSARYALVAVSTVAYGRRGYPISTWQVRRSMHRDLTIYIVLGMALVRGRPHTAHHAHIWHT